MKSIIWCALVALTTFLAACSNGGGGGDESTDTPTPPASRDVIVSEYDGTDPDRPRYSVKNLEGDRIDVFGATDASGEFVPRQAALKSAGSSAGSGNEYTVFFDDSGMPERINDHVNGRYVLVERIDGGTKFEMYDSANRFAGGFAILEDDSGPASVAVVLGQPAFEGQLVGNLAGAVNGSFAVVATPNSGLGAPADLPPMLRDYLSSAPDSALSTSVRAKSISSGLESLIRGGATTYLVAGALAGGAALAGVPVATAVGTVALVGFGVSLVAAVTRQGLQNLRNDPDLDAEARDTFDGLFGSFSDDGSPESLIENAKDNARSIAETGRAAIGTLVDRFVDRAGQTSDTVARLLLPSAQPQPVQGPPQIDTDVRGFGVDSSDRQYQYTGRVGSDRSVRLDGTADNGATQIQVNGAVDSSNQASGTYTASQGSGSFNGRASEFGVCEEVQNSGGQGTFSFVSDVGMAGGAVTFFYDAYSIPDAFTLRSNSVAVFSTGGLVSGSGSTTFIAPSSIVFVNVSAPNSGTAWEYSLSCAI